MHYQVIVLGCGPAGLNAALASARGGYSTAVVEPDQPGGTGLRWGCLPVKGGLDLLRHPGPGGLKPGASALIKAFRRRIARTVEAADETARRLEEAGVTLHRGVPRFTGPRSLELDGSSEELTADRIVIATGTVPACPTGFSLEEPGVISHRELLFLPEIPKSLVILGGNVEGIELACLFSGLGTKVTVVEMENALLPETDADLVPPVTAALKAAGVTLLTGAKAEGVEALSDGVGVRVTLAGRPETPEGEYLVVTGFRSPSIPAGWTECGGKTVDTGIPVDENFRTNLSGVYAVGDINGIMGMAHAAIHQAAHLPEIWEGKAVRQDYPLLPRSIFTIPEIAGAGVQELDLTPKGNRYTVRKAPLLSSWRGFIREEEGFVKLLFDEDDRLRGIWAVGRDVTEMMAFSGLILKAAPRREELAEALYIHPSLGEAILEAVRSEE